MRSLPPALLLALLPVAGSAQPLLESHFPPDFCWTRAYDAAHLAAHPEQRVAAIGIGREPVDMPSNPGVVPMTLRLRLLGIGEELTAIGYCQTEGAGLSCGLEGDSGDYALTAHGPEALLLTVGSRGMSFEGATGFHELRPDSGDDRAFLLSPCR